MAISKVNPVSASTEGIVTVKLSTPVTETTLPVPLPAGNYRIDTGFSGTLSVELSDSGSNVLATFSFATTSFFTITGTATKIFVAGPVAATNGVVTVNLLQRGVVGTAIWKVLNAEGANYKNVGMGTCNGRFYIIGGNDSGSYNANDGIGTIRYWDKTSSSFVTQYNSTNIAGQTWFAGAVGNVFYFAYKAGTAATTFTLCKFDTTTGTLTTLATPPAYASGALNNPILNNQGTKIYRFGNWDGASNNTCAVYDIATNTWTQLAALPSSAGVSWGTISHRDPANNDRINVYGISSQTQRYQYNIAANTFTALGSANNHSETTDSAYTSQGGVTPNGKYFVYVGVSSTSTTGDIPYQVFRQIKTDGSANVSTAASTKKNSLPFKPSGVISGTTGNVYFDSDNMYVMEGMAVDTAARPYLWILPVSYLPTLWTA